VTTSQELGLGLMWSATAQYATAPGLVLGEVALARANGGTTLRGAVYRRVASLNDWGYPFTLGESFAAAAYGRDEGFYVRTLGAEATLTRGGAWTTTWRAFAERHDAALVASRQTLFGGNDATWFIPNTTVREGWYGGVSVRARRTMGADPRDFRVFWDLRGEAAGGAAGYARGAAEGTVTRSLGLVTLAVTGAAGTTAGVVPPERAWWLGGARTVRGQPAGTLSGDAFRLVKGEIGVPIGFVRPAIFADAGWAGPRAALFSGGRPISGAGVGVSFLDGLVRVDVATGLAPVRRGPRVDFTLDVRF
jgi:hypothetical protein